MEEQEKCAVQNVEKEVTRKRLYQKKKISIIIPAIMNTRLAIKSPQ